MKKSSFIILILLPIIGSTDTGDTIGTNLFRTGLDNLLDHDLDKIRGEKIALVTNQTGIDRKGTPNYQRLMVIDDVHLKKIFSPEHGLFGEAAAGEKIHYSESLNDLPEVISLYGKIKKPSPEMLQGISLIIYDIQDVGARFYTYITTLGLVMEAAAENGIPVLVLDRPNPLGGEKIEGPILDIDHQSFVGYYPIPIRYGMTIGELAKMIVGEKWIRAIPELDVIEMSGWDRSMYFDDTGLTWVKPSPNIPDIETAIIYSGMCLVEGTNISEGRGTDHPFKYIGAPWMAEEVCMDLQGMKKLIGVEFIKQKFRPRSIKGVVNSPKYDGKSCIGFKVRVKDRAQYNSVLVGVQALYTVRNLTPWKLQLKEKHLNRLWGNDKLTKVLNDKLALAELLSTLDKDRTTFLQKRTPYLLYE
tara:strand:- start:91 stop:1338 length:1248 start_codon:yes stop_codon:yes gene_type:complete